MLLQNIMSTIYNLRNMSKVQYNITIHVIMKDSLRLYSVKLVILIGNTSP